jgi:hypothetical protein
MTKTVYRRRVELLLQLAKIAQDPAERRRLTGLAAEDMGRILDDDLEAPQAWQRRRSDDSAEA